MKNLITGFINIFRFHKFKLVLFFVFFLIFLITLFPYKDLGDLVTTQVAQATANNVYLTFNDLQPSVIPSVGLEFEDVTLDTPFVQAIKAKSFIVRPSIASFLAFKPGLAINASGLFKGKAAISGQVSGFSEEAFMKPKVSGELANVSLNELIKTLKLPVDLDGKLNLETDELNLDLINIQQIEGDVSAKVQDAKVGAMNIATPIGPLPLPAMNFKEIEVKADAKNGTVKVSKLTLGKPGDEFSGSAKGQFDLKNQGYGPPIGAYDFSIEIEVLGSFETKLGVIWSTVEGFIENYKRAGPPNKKVFAFRVSGQSVMAPPKISAYQ